MGVPVKLYIIKKNNKVLYAEAEKEFLDLLGRLLAIPIGVVGGIVDNASTASGLRSLYVSFKKLDSKYFNSDLSKELILNAPSIGSNSSLLDESIPSALVITKLYVCSQKTSESCRKYVSPIRSPCPTCRKDPIRWDGDGGYMKSAATKFVVMDDLSVTPLSTDVLIGLLRSLNLKAGTDLERKEVKVGKDQVIKLLRALPQHSKTVLTDVFLGKN